MSWKTKIFLGKRKGQAALSLVFLIGGIALLVSITLSLLAISFLNSTFAFQSANKAMAMATSGAEDALIRLSRDSTFSSVSGYGMPDNCSFGSADCTWVTVTQNSPATGQATIVSTATSFASQRKIQVVASIDQNSSQVSVVSWAVQIL